MMKNRWLSIVLSVALTGTLFSGNEPAQAAEGENPYQPVEFVTYEGAEFGRATEAYNSLPGIAAPGWGETTAPEINMEGMPLFNGNEENIDAYVDLLLEEMGPENWLILAGAGSTAEGTWSGGTYQIPSGTSIGGEALQGATEKTELSTTIHAAQSWNKELINRIGQLMSVENRGKQPQGGFYYVSSTGTSMTDMRLNPLSGRYDEGYGEDPYMASLFADLNARGYNGYGTDETGFYELGQVQTKHYSVYAAQFFRQIISTKVGARSFYEYNGYSANRGFQDGSISSFMSSYGRINGVPSSGSFITNWANEISKYGAVYNGPDAGATGGYAGSDLDGRWGNGYDDTYSPSVAYAAASMLAAGHHTTEDAVEAVEKGLNGVSYDNARVLAKAYILIRTRAGIYDERDADGRSKYYPFVQYGSDSENYQDESSTESQEVALQNAREGIVLLKNDNGALPLKSDTDIGIYGVFGDSVNAGYYAVVVPDTDGDGLSNYETRGQYAGLSPYEVISNMIEDGAKTGSVSFDQGLNRVTIQSANGKYLYVGKDDSIIQVKDDSEFDDADEGFYFAILDNGQESHSIYSYGSGKWVRAIIGDATVNYSAIVGCTSPFSDNSAEWTGSVVRADDDATFKFGPNPSGPPSMKSNFPYNLTLEPAGEDGEYYIRAGAKLNSISYITGVTPVLWTNYGYYLECSEDGTVSLGGAKIGSDSSTGDGIRYLNEKNDKSDLTFKVTEVQPYGYTVTEESIAGDDCAVIFVGQNYMTLSGEGTDRVSLEIGRSQLDTLNNIAKAYKAAGKKTIAVIYASYPVDADPIQNSSDIDAVLFAGYGGQYGSRALAEVLYGDYAPTGRLVSTWYKDIDLFPVIDEYAVPEGDNLSSVLADNSGRLTLADIDPHYTVDMTNADVIDTGLTYMYLTDEQIKNHVTYPFGYGLGYADFTFTNLNAPQSAEGTFTVTVDVHNDSETVATDETVQLYMSKNDSNYGSYVPLRKLVSFEKISLMPGETKTVTLTVDPIDIAVWDVNAEDYVVENGEYNLWVSDSSALTSENTLKCQITLTGKTLATLNTTDRVNVWEHSFASEGTYYREYSKLQTASSAVADGVNDDIYAVGSKKPGAWTAIPGVEFTGVTGVTLNVASTGSQPAIELHLDSPTGEIIGTASFQPTDEVEQTLVAADPADAEVIHELGYVDTAAKISDVSGIHDLYLVFKEKDTRIGTIQFQK